MQNKLLLCIGAILVLIGFFKPDLTSITLPVNVNEPACSVPFTSSVAPGFDVFIPTCAVSGNRIKSDEFWVLN